jgi:EAL domain-containing protein (putative c-di-GMP-specific phosphodiesterase class I)
VGATVIAEGIQTPEECEAIQNLGIRYGQGYLFGRPTDSPVSKTTTVAKETQ